MPSTAYGVGGESSVNTADANLASTRRKAVAAVVADRVILLRRKTRGALAEASGPPATGDLT
jgi:hypothetical protein